MFHLNKKEKLEIILEKVSEFSISAYEIGKSTNLTESGIRRILDGTVKNPHENTLNSILEFLEKYLLGRNIGKEIHIVSEPKTEYTNQEVTKRLIDCITESIELTGEITRLKLLLEKNNIEYKEKF